jgi:hypothetical protein
MLVLMSVPWLALPVSIRVAVYRIRYGVAAAVAKNGHCGSCGYWLAGLEPASDGCTFCPECGSAWRLPVISPRRGDGA